MKLSCAVVCVLICVVTSTDFGNPGDTKNFQARKSNLAEIDKAFNDYTREPVGDMKTKLKFVFLEAYEEMFNDTLTWLVHATVTANESDPQRSLIAWAWSKYPYDLRNVEAFFDSELIPSAHLAASLETSYFSLLNSSDANDQNVTAESLRKVRIIEAAVKDSTERFKTSGWLKGFESDLRRYAKKYTGSRHYAASKVTELHLSQIYYFRNFLVVTHSKKKSFAACDFRDTARTVDVPETNWRITAFHVPKNQKVDNKVASAVFGAVDKRKLSVFCSNLAKSIFKKSISQHCQKEQTSIIGVFPMDRDCFEFATTYRPYRILEITSVERYIPFFCKMRYALMVFGGSQI